MIFLVKAYFHLTVVFSYFSPCSAWSLGAHSLTLLTRTPLSPPQLLLDNRPKVQIKKSINNPLLSRSSSQRKEREVGGRASQVYRVGSVERSGMPRISLFLPPLGAASGTTALVPGRGAVPFLRQGRGFEFAAGEQGGEEQARWGEEQARRLAPSPALSASWGA